MIELIIAFALAAAVVGFLTAAANGFVLTPIEQPAAEYHGGGSLLSFVIAGRFFYADAVLATAIVVLSVMLLAGALRARSWPGALAGRARPQGVPHCLSEIRSAASVCSFCTRDVPPAAPTLVL